jgi:hypothetical protein
MTKPSDKILDDKIQAALELLEEEALPQFEEPSPWGQFLQLFQSGKAVWNYFALLFSLVLLSAAGGAVFIFFNQPELATKLAAASAFIVSSSILLAVKIYVWLEMQKLSLIREIKRLELQIAHLRQEFRQKL